ncbi:UNVERIFIED_CONTAM: hypothetical protein O8I53_09425 [Campylobacter lari]
MTALKALTSPFNKVIAITEFGANFILIFLVILIRYLFVRTNKNNKILMAVLITLVTFTSIVMF